MKKILTIISLGLMMAAMSCTKEESTQNEKGFGTISIDMALEDQTRTVTDDELRTMWGSDFEANYEFYKIAEVRAGIYHGNGVDMTDKMREYCAKMIVGDPEKSGCVEVNEELAEILQMLMDKYTFEGVENSWVKLCYYYEYIGEGWEWISPLR